jgi:hypothetical protein
MTNPARILAVTMAAGLTAAVLLTPVASAAPSCVAQSVQSEHQLYATAWGHDLVAYLATHPDELAAFGFDNFGDLASYAARQSHTNCPADL